jgi:uncharacterized protein (DUF433 family)
MATLLDHYIELRPTREGANKPYIAGTRIRVADIYVHHVLRGESAEQIVAAFPHLTISQVFAALAYCFDHLPEIRGELAADAEQVAKLRAELGPGPLAKKQQSHGDSLPPG